MDLLIQGQNIQSQLIKSFHDLNELNFCLAFQIKCLYENLHNNVFRNFIYNNIIMLSKFSKITLSILGPIS